MLLYGTFVRLEGALEDREVIHYWLVLELEIEQFMNRINHSFDMNSMTIVCCIHEYLRYIKRDFEDDLTSIVGY